MLNKYLQQTVCGVLPAISAEVSTFDPNGKDSQMRSYSSLTGVLILLLLSFTSIAQDDSTAIKKAKQKQRWLDNNMYERQDAVEFIKLAYDNFTSYIKKNEQTSGIYSRSLKLKGCELVIETNSRTQESSFKGDKTMVKNVVIIYLDKVRIEGHVLYSLNTEKPDGIFIGYSYSSAKPAGNYSILAGTPNPDVRFTIQNYEEHLQWAYEYLIGECAPKKPEPAPADK